MNQRPTSAEFATFYAPYVGQVPGHNIVAALQQGLKETTHFFQTLPEEKWNHRYAPGKWNIKELFLHVIDAERVFAYRALRIGRNDNTPLPGFAENSYVDFSNANSRSPESLIKEYKAVRKSTISLFEHFTEEDLMRLGTASGHTISCRALGFIIAGHERHHLNIVRERYLLPV